MSNLHYDGAWIDLIAVTNENRNKGIGKELVAFAENKIKKKKGEIITALVRKDNISSITMLSKSNFKSDKKEFLLYSKDIQKEEN